MSEGCGNPDNSMETEQVAENGPSTQSSTQPDTQNVDSQCFTQSQDTVVAYESVPRIWGRLCPHDSNLQTVVLTKDQYTFGRLADCDICVKNKLAPKREQVISKLHFRIYREKIVTSNGIEDDVVYLKDESQNGTFVNNISVGRGRSIILVNNDLIAVAKPHLKVFVYMSTSGYDDSFLPEQLKGKYAVSRTLGAGACGEVKLCFSKTELAGKKFAMKIISKSNMTITAPKNRINDDKQIINEVEICKKLKHPCIIKVEDFYESPQKVYIILELMEGGELFERIRKSNGLSEKLAKFIFYQIVLAVSYLHENGITHRDLKPENILLATHDEETIVKVSDFGLSKLVDSHTMMKTFCGTPMYVAPEILLTGGRGAYTSQVDIWSLGVILYCSLSGLTPFRIHDRQNPLADQIIKGMYNFNMPKFNRISPTAKDLITKMMTVDPKKRITIKNVLQHPWLNDSEMLTKVQKLLNLPNDENILRRPLNDNIIANAKNKRARLE
ncbi:ovarian-specific serine/threonine-protein kinase Lok-like [Phymastichus coffea]|uniref:ovarian-specific serine/threonine-protein kinase Lok-like n=1 Tax=Phymastichus coffea TaxID=108790 RepID=UPI00273C26AC|nr:ovarian-specific serine/threonine-protein kinase Lok-like [Phymastichus coffea]XP_058800440.1 ovarian-specific serine/threonine-protein kinase Lok-like [Phymastichus coffea]